MNRSEFVRTIKRMVKIYEDEQSRLISDLEKLEIEYYECKQINQNLTDWIKKIKKCLKIETLTRTIAVELIDRVEVSEIIDTAGEKSLDINIFYKFGLKECRKDKQTKRVS